MTRRIHPTCGSPEHSLHRRAFLGGVGGFLGGLAGLDALGSPLLADQVERRHKRVILLYMAGGSSQFETWDPKPGRPTGGPFGAIQTAVSGYRVCELMPRMAARIHKSAVIRSFSSPNTGHSGPSLQAILSGDRKDTPGVRTPSLGCLLGRELARPGSLVPDHVSFWNATWPFSGGDVQRDFGLFLGSRYEPTNIVGKLAPDGIRLPGNMTDDDHRARETLRLEFGTDRESQDTVVVAREVKRSGLNLAEGI